MLYAGSCEATKTEEANIIDTIMEEANSIAEAESHSATELHEN
jgi:hypothetical protein